MEHSVKEKSNYSSRIKYKELLEIIHRLQSKVDKLEAENLRLKKPKVPKDQQKLIDKLSRENSKLREELQKHRGTVEEIVGPYKQEIKGLSAKLETYKKQLQYYMNVLLYEVNGEEKKHGIGFRGVQRKEE